MKKKYCFKKNKAALEDFKKEIESKAFEIEVEEDSVTVEVDDCRLCDLEYKVDWLTYLMEANQKYFESELNYIYQRMYEHSKGHLPPIMDADKMKGALNALGLGDSFQVYLPTVSVSKVGSTYVVSSEKPKV